MLLFNLHDTVPSLDTVAWYVCLILMSSTGTKLPSNEMYPVVTFQELYLAFWSNTWLQVMQINSWQHDQNEWNVWFPLGGNECRRENLIIYLCLLCSETGQKSI